jgi:hypothetical protein
MVHYTMYLLMHRVNTLQNGTLYNVFTHASRKYIAKWYIIQCIYYAWLFNAVLKNNK